MISDALIVAAISGPVAVAARDAVVWIRNRRKDQAEAGLTVDQRWERYADSQDERITRLEERVTETERELKHERDRSKGLTAEVDRYKRIARSLLRHVIRLREELGKASGEVPDLPPDVEDALTAINLN